MTHRLTIAAAAVALLATPGAVRAQDAPKGKQVYAAAKCKTCHAIAGDGNAKGSLDDAGKLSVADLKAWIRTPKEMTAKAKATRKPPMPAYPAAKISDADLDALAAYLSSLKK